MFVDQWVSGAHNIACQASNVMYVVGIAELRHLSYSSRPAAEMRGVVPLSPRSRGSPSGRMPVRAGGAAEPLT